MAKTKYLEYVLLDAKSDLVYPVGTWALLKRDGYCPVCREKVFPRRLPRNGWGAVHYRGQLCSKVTVESEIHKDAKNQIAHYCEEYMLEQMYSTERLALSVAMPGMKRPLRIRDWGAAVTEHPVGIQKSGKPAYLLDVALLDYNGGVRAAIEICHEHPVDDAKAAGLASLGIPWVEVDAKVGVQWLGIPNVLMVTRMVR